MNTADAIRSRRTVKAFAPHPVAHDVLVELLELARWAPNHKLSGPWRFRVVGPDALRRLKQAAADVAVASAGGDIEKLRAAAAAKLDRAPTLVVCSTIV